MNQDEFLKKIFNLKLYLYCKEGEKLVPLDKSNFLKKPTGRSIRVMPTLDSYLHEKWCTGGLSGGSCWDEGESRHYATSGEPEPDFTDLDTILEEICPNITFLQYKTLMSAILKRGERTDYEYYGNSITYGEKTIRLGDLFEKLKEKNLL